MGPRTLIDGLRANACVVHEVTPDAAAAFVAGRAAELWGHGPIAVATGDPVLVELGIVDSLRASGLPLLEPDDRDWHERLATATVGVTGAALAVEEPPVFALRSGPGMPRAVSLLPPVHLCVLPTSAVLPTLGEAISKLAAEPLPSAWSWIGGPSRTGDLEMVQTLGVHGPVAVEVVVVG